MSIITGGRSNKKQDRQRQSRITHRPRHAFTYLGSFVTPSRAPINRLHHYPAAYS